MSKTRTTPPRAMVLAAGLGLRMRPLTVSRPKPLVLVSGRTLLDRVLDRLDQAGVDTAVVNTHYLAGLVERHLTTRQKPSIVISPEPQILDTGGGVAKALPHLGKAPFYVANVDSVWLDGPEPALNRLARSFDPDGMDGLLLLAPTVTSHGYDGPGDFLADGLGRLRRRPKVQVSPFVFTGVQILSQRLFDGAPAGVFSLNLLYDRAIESGRLYGLVHDGEWFHVGTPDGLTEAERGLASSREGPNRR
ncbi:MAG: nucleotidyltransferase family protein [Rhodospirillales bacterium]|nr:nucleotidyltransferase family protein [Rhodospirillales bacterium]